MKRFKKFLFLAMLVAMSFGFNNVVNAEEKFEKPKEVDIVKLKQDIVNQNSNKQIYFTKSDLDARTSFIEEEIHKMYAKGLTEEEITKQAEELGLVELIVPEESANNVPTSDRANVSLGKPSIFYDSLAKQWVVSTSANWLNKGWKGDIPSCCFSTTKAVDVGGADAFGITYYNTSGTYNTAVKSSSFVATSGNGWVKNSGSPSHGNGKLGVAFEFQDQARLLTNCCDNFEFLGNNMSIVMTYDSNFSNFHGYARTFYTHTWDKAGITSINFGASSSSFGVNVVVSNTSYGWTIYNGSDATF